MFYKEVKSSDPSSNIAMLIHLDKFNVSKQVKFPKSSGNAVTLKYPYKYNGLRSQVP